MLKEFTCIVCPNSCDITAEVEGETILSIQGASCRRGEDYVRQELTDPRRTISTSVAVKNGELPLVSVRLTAPVPKDRIFDVMKEIAGLEVEAPTRIGDCLIENVLGLSSDVIATKNVARKGNA